MYRDTGKVSYSGFLPVNSEFVQVKADENTFEQRYECSSCLGYAVSFGVLVPAFQRLLPPAS
jgi:hypothetical protein